MRLSSHSNKPRLYVAVYEEGGPAGSKQEQQKYRWDLIVGPKTEKADPVPGIRYRVLHGQQDGWMYSESQVTNVRTPYNMLVRVLIAKVEDMGRLSDTLRNTPIAQGGGGFCSRVWVAEALARVAEDGKIVGTANLDWDKIEATARGFVREKMAEGRFVGAKFDLPQPMWNLLEDREVLP